MPVFEKAPPSLDIRRNAVLLDANVLIHAFETRRSDRSEEALYFLTEYHAQWLIPISVLVECWGFLVGSRKDLTAGDKLLAWVNTPGTSVVLPELGDNTSMIHELIRELRIDCVDAMVMSAATDVTEQCGLEENLPVATYDTRDFIKAFGHARAKLTLYDLRTDWGDLPGWDP